MIFVRCVSAYPVEIVRAPAVYLSPIRSLQINDHWQIILRPSLIMYRWTIPSLEPGVSIKCTLLLLLCDNNRRNAIITVRRSLLSLSTLSAVRCNVHFPVFCKLFARKIHSRNKVVFPEYCKFTSVYSLSTWRKVVKFMNKVLFYWFQKKNWIYMFFLE